MDRRRDTRYKQQEPAHHYDDRYNATYDNYDYEEDYGNQYANTVPHHHHAHAHAHAHHPEEHGYDDEEDHWANQQDFYDTVPANNLPPVKPMGPPKNLARVQISTSIPEPDNAFIPQAPPPPRFGPTGGYNNNNNNDRKTPVSKYGNMATTDLKQRRETADVHIRFDPAAKREFHPKQTSFIDGFRNGDSRDSTVPSAKKKDTVAGGQTTNTIRSIINNLKSGGNEKQEDTIPRNRVSTNPFMRAQQQQQQQQNHPQNRLEPKNPSKNVAEVVEKMNNGDWPIQIDDEDPSPNSDPKRAYQQHPDKARQWETLHRKKDEKKSILEDVPHLTNAPPSAPPLPTQQPPSQKQQYPPKEENDKMSDKSHEETSVSTDSALYSESSDTRGPSPYKLPFDTQKPGELGEEAEKLLFYFKTHKDVLNYLGIGLTDRLWKHIQKLPNFESSIRVFKKQEELTTSSKAPPAPPLLPTSSANIPPAPKITLSQSFAPQDRKSPIGHSHNRSVSQNEDVYPQNNTIAQSDDSRFTKNPENISASNRDQRSNNGGRFVKKSAAALIAKKQGMQSEDPNSATEIIDPRIAEEIKNLRDREEELKRSRSELALVTSPPPSSYQMSPKKTSPGSNMRSAQSYDHLDSSVRSPIERSHSSHNVYHMKSATNGDSSYHLGGAYGNANYGSMPRPQHRKEGSYHTQMHDPRTPHDAGYRQSRNGDFFRQTPAPSEKTNAGWQKSPASFETKPPVAIHSGLQLPSSANISISSYQQRSNNDKYQNPKSMYSGHDSHRKIGL
ncbi:hypothetical protein L5515_013750 [Caenorhabditis briggsae]|uniref:Uncharacterized protein n=1 Tax=Caenorhabditis briggsae TaxID=6238 RepID=A0AAE9E9K0_CAEBR|nr:hypothetical protein L5515_013750 [Caenorhabditis briggsae]